jgi:hypothetical protein
MKVSLEGWLPPKIYVEITERNGKRILTTRPVSGEVHAVVAKSFPGDWDGKLQTGGKVNEIATGDLAKLIVQLAVAGREVVGFYLDNDPDLYYPERAK